MRVDFVLTLETLTGVAWINFKKGDCHARKTINYLLPQSSFVQKN